MYWRYIHPGSSRAHVYHLDGKSVQHCLPNGFRGSCRQVAGPWWAWYTPGAAEQHLKLRNVMWVWSERKWNMSTVLIGSCSTFIQMWHATQTHGSFKAPQWPERLHVRRKLNCTPFIKIYWSKQLYPTHSFQLSYGIELKTNQYPSVNSKIADTFGYSSDG